MEKYLSTVVGCLLLLMGLVIVEGSPVKQSNESGTKHLVGAKECTWGPTYWCANLSNAKSCGAVSHCIQTVWETQRYPVDNDEICNICLDMVRQARDQLESNETQSDLKDVFEGSCNLIPVKVVKKECRKLADDFVPELVEALASQMNPNVVCSVAGLCNNAAIDKLLADMLATKSPQYSEIDEKVDPFTCQQCNNISTRIVRRFRASDRDNVLESFLRFCGQMSSYSDACSSIVLTYFSELYEHLNIHLTPDAICHLSGVCATNFHRHEDDVDSIEVRPLSGVGVLRVSSKCASDDCNLGDDVPCKLCEQLVNHLRDVLIANTTELEFKQVLEGLCKQTKSFAEECTNLVDQYYAEIYETLVHNLNSNDACFMIGVCPKNVPFDSALMPLLPLSVAIQHESDSPALRRPILGINEPIMSPMEIQQAQLPIDRIMGAPSALQLKENGKFCTLCEYFMHFVQEALSEPANEDEIKHVVGTTCDRLPSSIRGECHNFIDVYGDAVIALLIQSMDPRQVCPTLKFCPVQASIDAEVFAPAQVDVEVDVHAGNGKPTCPLCLFAVSQLEESVKTDRSKHNIESALARLCMHLSPKLRLECTDFVDTYTSELVEMLASDFTPQEICVFLKLCIDQRPDLSLLSLQLEYEQRPRKMVMGGSAAISGDIETNEIPDNTVNGKPMEGESSKIGSTQCLVCQEMVKQVEKRVKNKKNREEIQNALDHVCERMKEYRDRCEQYVQKHADQIIDLVLKQLSPKEICHVLGFCITKASFEERVGEALLDYIIEPAIVEPPMEVLSTPFLVRSDGSVHGSEPPQCALCEFVMVKLESELADKKTRETIKNAVRNVCSKLPATINKQCSKFIDQYGEVIIKFLETLPPHQMCTKLELCEPQEMHQVALLEQAKKETMECAVCQGAVKGLDELLTEIQIEEQVSKYANRICKELPAKNYAQCDRLLSIYGISMMKQLKHSIEREQVCVNMDMCSSMQPTINAGSMPEFASEDENDDEDLEVATGDSDSDDVISNNVPKKNAILLGQNQCSWGPAYWCKDEQTAKECKSTEYCMKRKLGLWKQ
ncbi:saposin [Anopheles darlingi]|uniref:Saposin n=1 Tax=Anopheles darlingi TaxID=43151 RepID=W5JL43_ANODA|nr:saposin [Anopheles darlingi]